MSVDVSEVHRSPKRPKHLCYEDKPVDTQKRNTNTRGQKGPFGFHDDNSLVHCLGFLSSAELARNQTISKSVKDHFEEAFKLQETYNFVPRNCKIDSDLKRASAIANKCKMLKRVSVNTILLYQIPGRDYDLTSDLVKVLDNNAKHISSLCIVDEFRYITFPSISDAILTSCGQKLTTLDLGVDDINLDLHEFIQSCPNLQFFGFPLSGILDEASATETDCLHHLTEVVVHSHVVCEEVAKLMARAPNLDTLRIERFNSSLVHALKCFSGRTLEVRHDMDFSNSSLGEVFRTLRRDGVVLSGLRKFSCSGRDDASVDFVAVVPNLTVYRTRYGCSLEILEEFHKGGLPIKCLLITGWRKCMADFVGRRNVFPELRHCSGFRAIWRWFNKRHIECGVPFTLFYNYPC